jgi:hypothetical protein
MEEKTMMAHLRDMIENHFSNIRRSKLTEHYHEQLTDEKFVAHLKMLRVMEESVYATLEQAEEV